MASSEFAIVCAYYAAHPEQNIENPHFHYRAPTLWEQVCKAIHDELWLTTGGPLNHIFYLMCQPWFRYEEANERANNEAMNKWAVSQGYEPANFQTTGEFLAELNADRKYGAQAGYLSDPAQDWRDYQEFQRQIADSDIKPHAGPMDYYPESSIPPRPKVGPFG